MDSGRANVAAPGQPMHFMSAPESHDSSSDLERAVGGGSLSSKKRRGGEGEVRRGSWSCAPAVWASATDDAAATNVTAVKAKASRCVAEARMAAVDLTTSRLDEPGIEGAGTIH